MILKYLILLAQVPDPSQNASAAAAAAADPCCPAVCSTKCGCPRVCKTDVGLLKMVQQATGGEAAESSSAGSAAGVKMPEM